MTTPNEKPTTSPAPVSAPLPAGLWGIRWIGNLNKWWGTDGWSDDLRLAHRFADKEHAEANIRISELPLDVSVAQQLPTPSPAGGVREAFQQRVQPWMMACFGAEISADVVERNHRFLEEALELVQSTGCTASEAHQLVNYVFGREIGETHQEIGGVMVTLAALCLALGEDMHAAGENELARIWTKVEKIRAKQAAKPKHSPLPQLLPALSSPATPG